MILFLEISESMSFGYQLVIRNFSPTFFHITTSFLADLSHSWSASVNHQLNPLGGWTRGKFSRFEDNALYLRLSFPLQL